MSKKVIITGVTGQFGSFMADHLLKNTDYEIHGMVRRLSVENHKNIKHLKTNPRFHLFSGDLTDGHSLQKSIEEIKPDYYINAGAQSFVSESWVTPVNTFITDSVAIIHILEAIRKIVPYCRFVNMGSSEQFGDVQYSPQDINHPFRSRSIYAAAKVASHQIVKVYRESYRLFAIQPICFNYEGIKRGEEFVTKKISKGVARIYYALKNNQPFDPIELGGYDSQRDWSDAEDVVDAAWRMLNQETYNDDIRYELSLEVVDKWKCLISNIKEYIVSSGETHKIREFVEMAFREAGITTGVWYKFSDKSEDEKFVDGRGGSPIYVQINSKFYRPAEVNLLCGDSTPIRQELGWQPQTSFKELVKKMVDYDIKNYSE